MIFVRRQVSLCNLVAVIFAAAGILLGSGCARITSMDLQIAPPGPTDNAPDESESASSDQATAALTPPSSGDILMIGGAGSAKSTIASAEFFSAATSKFKATGAMKKTRAVAGGVALPAQHEVAIFGGMKGHATSSIELLTLHSTVLNSAETYDSTTGKFTTVATPMDDARTGFTATFFPSGPLSGKVLIAGGSDGTGPTDSAEIFDPSNNTFTAAGNTMTDPREYHTATLLNDGTVLLAGGLKDPAGDVSTTADIF